VSRCIGLEARPDFDEFFDWFKSDPIVLGRPQATGTFDPESTSVDVDQHKLKKESFLSTRFAAGQRRGRGEVSLSMEL
jgi:hypothetical protein